MKRTITFSILAVLLAFLLPVLLSAAPGARPAADAEAPELSPPPSAGTAGAPVLDAEIALTVRTDEGDMELRMADYLPLALAGEMPASFDNEALKAQAVALRSYVLHFRENRKDRHPEADVCTSPDCCAAFAATGALQTLWGDNFDVWYEKMRTAVAETDGQYLVYESAPILAVFHSASRGATEDGASVGILEPYLVSVSSPETAETVTNLNTTVEVTPEEFQAAVRGAFPEAALDGDPAGWLGAVSLNAAGRVAQVQIGGVSVSGLALRQLFALRSTDFTLLWDDGGQRFVFRVSGYGHGAGLSQYGANLLAKAGADYTEILAHYYPGTELVVAFAETS